jgi:hypothetical protein
MSSSVSCSPKWSINTSQLQVFFAVNRHSLKFHTHKHFHLRNRPVLIRQYGFSHATFFLTRRQTRGQQVTVHTGIPSRLFGRTRNKRASSQVVRLLTKNILAAKGVWFLCFNGQNPTCNALLFLKIMHQSPATRRFLHYLK